MRSERVPSLLLPLLAAALLAAAAASRDFIAAAVEEEEEEIGAAGGPVEAAATAATQSAPQPEVLWAEPAEAPASDAPRACSMEPMVRMWRAVSSAGTCAGEAQAMTWYLLTMSMRSYSLPMEALFRRMMEACARRSNTALRLREV
jgi:hypothetical protein